MQAECSFNRYALKDSKHGLINYDLCDSTCIIPKIVDKGYIEIGKKHMDSSRQGNVMTDQTPRLSQYASEPTLR
jgi:hypothetical protein